MNNRNYRVGYLQNKLIRIEGNDFSCVWLNNSGDLIDIVDWDHGIIHVQRVFGGPNGSNERGDVVKFALQDE